MTNVWRRQKGKERRWAALLEREPALREQLYGAGRVQMATGVGGACGQVDLKAAYERTSVHLLGERQPLSS